MKNRLYAGLLAGALGGTAMKAVVRFADANAFGLSSTTDAKAAREVYRMAGWGPVEERRAELIGGAMHYGFAMATGALYAAVAERFPAARAGHGTVFGLLLWLFGAELMVTVSGLEDPRRTRALSHLSSLGAHILYGVINDRALGRSAK